MASKIPPLDWNNVFIGRDNAGNLDEDKTELMLPRSDVEMAAAIARHMGGRICFGEQTKEWRYWDGRVHVRDTAGEIGRFTQDLCFDYRDAMQIIKAPYVAMAETAALAKSDDKKASEEYGKVMAEYRSRWKQHRSFRDRLFMHAGQEALNKELKRHCVRSDEEWDADTEILVFRNGVMHLRELFDFGPDEVELMDHDPVRRVTKMVPHDYNPHAVSLSWDHYLKTALPNVDVRNFLWHAAASALTGDPSHKSIFNLIGEGDTGKTVFLNMVGKAIGDYGQNVPVKVFLQKSSDSDFERDLMKGARFVSASEPAKGKRFDDDVLKSISGRDVQTTAAKFQKATSWVPQCTIFIASNHAVKFDTTDAAFLRRIKPVRFPTRFIDSPTADPSVRMDRGLEHKISREIDGVVNWLVRGLYDYMRDGLVEPDDVAAARSDMQTSLEPVLEWAGEQVSEGLLQVHGAGEIPASHGAQVSELFKLYRLWEEQQGERIRIGRKTFSSVMQSRYGPTVKSSGIRFGTMSIDHERLTMEQKLVLSC